MKRSKYLLSLMVILSLAFVFTGCAKPPDAEKSAAKTAMDAAVSAGADKYTAADLTAAKSLWDTAESQMTDKKYKDAKQSYIDAKSAFEKAAAGVETGKKAMIGEDNAAVTGLESAWKDLEAGAKTKLKRMKDKKADWDADAKTFADGLKATKDMIAADPAGAKAKASELKAITDKWAAAFAEPAAAPAGTEAPKTK
jgi:hypothetical protein